MEKFHPKEITAKPIIYTRKEENKEFLPDEIIMSGDRVEGNLEKIKNFSIGTLEINSKTILLLMPKSRRSAKEPGLDNMLLVIKRQGKISNINEMDSKDFSKVLSVGEDVLKLYSKENPHLQQFILALSFHDNPVEEKVFGIKKHAQTIPDLHIHVTAFTEDELKGEKINRKTPSSKSGLDKYESDDVNDPGFFLAEKIVGIPTVQKKLNKNLLHLSPTEGRHGAFHFKTHETSIDPSDLAKDLQTLHSNAQEIYQEILNIFTDSSSLDSTGMPTLRDKQQIAEAINKYIEKLKLEKENSEFLNQIDTLQSLMKKWVKIMISGEKAKSQLENSQSTRVFIRGYAYTLSIIRNTNESSLKINFAPRIFSTGDSMSALGFHKILDTPTDEKYLQQTEAVYKNLKKYFN